MRIHLIKGRHGNWLALGNHAWCVWNNSYGWHMSHAWTDGKKPMWAIVPLKLAIRHPIQFIKAIQTNGTSPDIGIAA